MQKKKKYMNTLGTIRGIPKMEGNEAWNKMFAPSKVIKWLQSCMMTWLWKPQWHMYSAFKLGTPLIQNKRLLSSAPSPQSLLKPKNSKT